MEELGEKTKAEKYSERRRMKLKYEVAWLEVPLALPPADERLLACAMPWVVARGWGTFAIALGDRGDQETLAAARSGSST
ncbi:MAG TPA: hypothetical protein VGE39_04200, partial [Prosthecobacter sp.]